MAEIALPPEVASVVKRPDVRMIIGAALGGLAIGLFIGVKLAGPKTWVPEATEAPCVECEEKRQVGSPADLAPAEVDELRRALAEALHAEIKIAGDPEEHVEVLAGTEDRGDVSD